MSRPVEVFKRIYVGMSDGNSQYDVKHDCFGVFLEFGVIDGDSVAIIERDDASVIPVDLRDFKFVDSKESTGVSGRLAKAGVFKGAHGLEGLANCQEFWDKQPYETRLYYGGGIADYLHRDVLKAAIRILMGRYFGEHEKS